MKDLEIWKIVKLDFNSTGLLVSSHGGIKNSSFVDRKVGDNGAGYKFASIQVLGERRGKKFYIHRLVAQQFLPKPEAHQTQVNHLDGNKENNCVSNLEWICPKENIKHSHETGLSKGRREHGTTVKLPDKSVANAYLSVKIGMYGVREAADKYGMPRTTLSSIMNKRSRRSVTDTIDTYFMLK